MIKHFSRVTALGLSVFAASAHAQSVPSGRDVLMRSLEVTGADTVLPTHKSLKMSGNFVTPNMEFSGPTLHVRTSTGEFRRVMDVQGYGLIENGYADGSGYSINAKVGTELWAGVQLAQARAQAVWLDTPDNYLVISNKGRVKFDGKDAYRLELISKDSLKTIGFFEVATGLPLGTASQLGTPDGPVEVHQVWTDYRNVGGMLIPGTIRLVGGSGQIVTFDKIEWDVATPADYALPSVVATMKKIGLT